MQTFHTVKPKKARTKFLSSIDKESVRIVKFPIELNLIN